MKSSTRQINQNSDSSLSIRGLKKVDVWDHENAFYWFTHPTRISKLISHYELYKSILGLPGDVFELGVYKGASLTRLATFRSILENDFSRKIVGFDAFGKFPRSNLSLKEDLDFIDVFEGAGGDGLSIDEVEAVLKTKNFQNIILNEGNVFDTLPAYLDLNPATRISLLHLDMDVKEPTVYALDLLYSRIVPNGLIVFDDYNAVPGETDAVDEFIAKHRLRIEKTPYCYIPSYIRKPG